MFTLEQRQAGFTVDIPHTPIGGVPAGSGDDDDDPPVKVLSQEDFVHFVDSLSASKRDYLFPENVFCLFTWHFELGQLGSSRNVWGKWDPLFTVSSSLLGSSSPLKHPPVGCEFETQSEGSLSGLAFASMVTPTTPGLLCFTDVFGVITRQADVTPHLKELVGWLKGQRAKYSVNDDYNSDTIVVFFYTNTLEEEKLLSDAVGSFGGFCSMVYYMTKMHYFWQDFETLKAM